MPEPITTDEPSNLEIIAREGRRAVVLRTVEGVSRRQRIEWGGERPRSSILNDLFHPQKSRRSPSWIARGSLPCVVITPKVCGLCKFTVGSAKFT